MSLLVEHPANGAPRRAPVTRGADGVLHYGGLEPALTELLDVRVHQYANREALVELGGPRLTYRELWTSASRVAGGLNKRGIGYGDRVGIQLRNGARWVQAFLGALLSGAVPVPINGAIGAPELARVRDDSAVDFVIDDELPDGTAFIDDGASLDETALLCYTSGIHGPPKGVELSNENLLSAIESVIAALALPRTGLRNLVLLPLAHASGCVDQLLPTLAVGGTVLVAPDIGPDALARALSTEKVDMVAASVERYHELCTDSAGDAGDRAAIAAVCCSGGALDIDDSRRLRAMFPGAVQCSLWGTTETSGIALMLTGESGSDAPGLIGTPFGAIDLALLGPDADHGVGELLCRGPNVAHGYWHDPDATARHFTANWFHTGDFAEVDRDGLVRMRASAQQTVA